MTQIQRIKLPSDTCSFFKNQNIYDIENFNLLLNKYAEFEDNMTRNLPEIDSSKFSSCIKFIKKQKYLIERYKSQGYDVDTYIFRPDSRIVVGLGQESVREVSMALHWIYGIPYIPGQAVKGVVSNWVISEGGEDDENFKLIFGDEDNKGKVIFLDSYPENNSFYIRKDIMNPHYTDYYTKKDFYPTDWQDPNPIFFLTLERVVFNIYLIYLKKDIRYLKIVGKTLEEWMIEAFKYGGVGAKTSLGYGTGQLTLIGGNM
ncbi:type III-B CRISPR module RAMP protein Cmr6 [Thermoanaerobacterium thermosaccharolyticum]|uniref:type III-B CRISPR module RAMP protein Cmr6 n=1 Tax=Thermoanaerobacterium thermosaccharolyticum TaxID=1517 RepID=UPI003DA83DEE